MDHDQQGAHYTPTRRSSAQSSKHASTGYAPNLALTNIGNSIAPDVTCPQSAYYTGEDSVHQLPSTSCQAIDGQPLYYDTPLNIYIPHNQPQLNMGLSDPSNTHVNSTPDWAQTLYASSDSASIHTSSPSSESAQGPLDLQSSYSRNVFGHAGSQFGWAPQSTSIPTIVNPLLTYRGSMVPLEQGHFLPLDGQHALEQASPDGYISSFHQMAISSTAPAIPEHHTSMDMTYQQQVVTVNSAPNLVRSNALYGKQHETVTYREPTAQPSRPMISPPYNNSPGLSSPVEVEYESQPQSPLRATVVSPTKSHFRRPRNKTPKSPEPSPSGQQYVERSPRNPDPQQVQRNPSQDRLHHSQNPKRLRQNSDISLFEPTTSSDPPPFPIPDLSFSNTMLGSNAIYSVQPAGSSDYATSKAHNNERRSAQRANSAESNKESHKCKKCAASYTRKDNLGRHVNELHKGSIKWKCPMCSKEFPRRHNGIEHVQKGHGAPKRRDIECTQDTHNISFARAQCHTCRKTISMKDIVAHFEETPCAPSIKSACNTDQRGKYFDYWYPRCCGSPLSYQ